MDNGRASGGVPPTGASPWEGHRIAFEGYLETLNFSDEPLLQRLVEAMRYSMLGGGKRVRPTMCMEVARVFGAEPSVTLPSAAAIELIHTYSLIHDDLPAMDDDDERRGRPSTHAHFGEAVAILAGDALLAEAFRLSLSYQTTDVARELTQATLAMIGGQYLDVTGAEVALPELHRLKTGALFAASVACGLWAAGVAERDQAPWRAFGAELGLLFQIVDDVMDGDGYAREHGEARARELADEAAERAHERLAAIDTDTSVLREIVDGLAARTS